jgi:hypothetical protein
MRNASEAAPDDAAAGAMSGPGVLQGCGPTAPHDVRERPTLERRAHGGPGASDDEPAAGAAQRLWR